MARNARKLQRTFGLDDLEQLRVALPEAREPAGDQVEEDPGGRVNGDAHANDDHQHGTHLASLLAAIGLHLTRLTPALQCAW